MKTLSIEAAATVLHMSKDALMRKARAGIVPGCKPGRSWVFLEDDLRIYLAKLVRERACRSIATLRAPTGGSDSALVESRLDAALARQAAMLQKNSKHNSETGSGESPSSVRSQHIPGRKPSRDGQTRLRLVTRSETGNA